jgi:hypothetical protein
VSTQHVRAVIAAPPAPSATCSAALHHIVVRPTAPRVPATLFVDHAIVVIPFIRVAALRAMLPVAPHVAPPIIAHHVIVVITSVRVVALPRL